MELGTFLSVENTLLDAQGTNKTRLLNDLCARAAAALGLEAKSISREIQKREELGPTGVGGGVAIPHARVEGVKSAFGVLARLRTPVDFDAIDGQPVDIVFLLLLPTTVAGEHLNVLAAVARKLRDPAALRALRDARDRTALHDAMVSP